MSSPTHTEPSAIRVALIGAGQVGKMHGEAFARLAPQVQVVAVADADEARAASLAAACGAQPYQDYHQALALQPEAVVVSLPHHLHRQAGLAAAAAGCHILMEKPLAPTLEESQTIVDACQQRGLRLAVGFVHRFRTEWGMAHRLLQKGDLGAPTMALDVFGMMGGGRLPPWVWRSRREGGGILMYSGVHSIDWQCWLLGSEVAEVFARSTTQHPGSDAEDSVAATLAFANGCTGALLGNQPDYLITPRTREFELYGTRGRLRIRNGEYLEYSNDERAFRLEVSRENPFVLQAREFV
ncbi:MAG: Gfo/Idh/MocA family oxidoreductase, partial [Chloroflexi bacterium]|nr:Gfo/Idh/MocA family oxidoreductase [Chloroflexota bacterium]